jgi:hypothetical protein
MMLNRQSFAAGRGLWFSGSAAHKKIGGAGLTNCWFLKASSFHNMTMLVDLSMLGGGVGVDVRRRTVQQLPRIKLLDKPISCVQSNADFSVPDTREGWVELVRRVYEAYCTGKGFTYDVNNVRPKGARIVTFGGVSSGPEPLLQGIEDLCTILDGVCILFNGFIRPIDVADLACACGQMVKSGNVRRSALIIIGDPDDSDFLLAKRWDLGTIPNYRSNANFSVYASKPEQLTELFWETYYHGEAFGIVNLENIQKYGRMGEEQPDTAEGVNPCAEATLENGEPCNLFEIFLKNIHETSRFVECAKAAVRAAKRVTLEPYHHDVSQEVIAKNRRFGIGLSGCLVSPLFSTPDILDHVYNEIIKADVAYSKELNIPPSIRRTVIKPGGTTSKTADMEGYEGISRAYSQYIIQRIRFDTKNELVPRLKAANHFMEPEYRLDGTQDPNIMVVDFYVKAPDGAPVADKNGSLKEQLDTALYAHKHWADQSVSVSIYYKKNEIEFIKEWVGNNLRNLKTISFLCHDDHGYRQAPKEAITKEQYEELSSKLLPVDLSDLACGEDDVIVESCEGGACPVR